MQLPKDDYAELVNSPVPLPVTKLIRDHLSNPKTGATLARLLQRMHGQFLPKLGK